MATIRTSASRRSPRSGRQALIVLLAGAGVVLSPVTAQAASGGSTASAVAAAPAAASTGTAQVAVNTALAQLGDPYVWGGAGPNSFDCSGLTQFAYAAAGIQLPHSSQMQSTIGTPVARANLQPGDLVFFYSPVGHVAMYIGNGQIVHAPTSGDVVKVTNLDYMTGYNSARRLG